MDLMRNSLIDLAARAGEAWRKAREAQKTAAEKALEAGHLLAEAKMEVAHGEWLPFLKRATIPERQAQRLMLLHRSCMKADTVSDLGIRGALEFLARAKAPAPDELLIAKAHGGMAYAIVWDDPAHAEFSPFFAVTADGAAHDGRRGVRGSALAVVLMSLLRAEARDIAFERLPASAGSDLINWFSDFFDGAQVGDKRSP